jgi:hypothetical protein
MQERAPRRKSPQATNHPLLRAAHVGGTLAGVEQAAVDLADRLNRADLAAATAAIASSIKDIPLATRPEATYTCPTSA